MRHNLSCYRVLYCLLTGIMLYMRPGKQGLDSWQESQRGSGLTPRSEQLGFEFDTSDAILFHVRDSEGSSVPALAI